MGIHLERALLFCTLLVLTHGLEIPDPDHIDYIRQQAKAVINTTVSLKCGSSMPTLFIWVFSKTEFDSSEALAYNYGLGPKTLPLANTLGDPFLAVNTSSLQIMQIQAEAEGIYTCQALYDTDKGPRVTFYYTHLSLQGQQNTAKGSGSV
ncbi:pregnancy-specific beta-1-glycoprotein 11 isoform X2 [Silurus meridionalis]|uniref:Ig-like domain-containing protein n=1 Tax=Silurus meridionalis TaxID=175797 RepID=A0A8T0B452_SILME|nr:hypothetical protein HF521_003927 [Silurus meridionalis]KAI5098311.1 pregnancy-specific beta-1-glycoprotein 11 isoform X2 [Silurus meridionalis]